MNLSRKKKKNDNWELLWDSSVNVYKLMIKPTVQMLSMRSSYIKEK